MIKQSLKEVIEYLEERIKADWNFSSQITDPLLTLNRASLCLQVELATIDERSHIIFKKQEESTKGIKP